MRRTPMIALGAAALLAGPLSGPVAAAREPVPCPGTVTGVVQTLVKAEQRGDRTLLEFDFTAKHTLCPAPNESVEADQIGHLWFNLDAAGTGRVRFTSTVHYQGATLQGDGGGTVTASGIMGTGRAYGGTGALAGVQGRGEFWSTGPDSFADLIWYIYPRG
jgi:hypothetical protein